ncbi:hypothetical protein QYE76_001430 [Lolium multiflorum]|uniref:TF-B3 domain-containing protein n=1 Tax=Lolium multiflorum TaxID=4521 RepID=A0AAD8RLU0_LOLMU|nr:hypothetical protein QYE76_001430 [Lolium multiflorum]
MNWDRLRLPQRFAPIVNVKEPRDVVLRVSGGAIGLWPEEVLFDDEGQMFLNNGWRRFARAHAIKAGHFIVFKYDGHGNAHRQGL